MNGPDHFRKAEDMLSDCASTEQVALGHAVLALVAVLANANSLADRPSYYVDPEALTWQRVLR